MSRTGLSPSYLGCGRLTTEGYGSARRERVHGLHQFLMSMSVGRYHCIQSSARRDTIAQMSARSVHSWQWG